MLPPPPTLDLPSVAGISVSVGNGKEMEKGNPLNLTKTIRFIPDSKCFSKRARKWEHMETLTGFEALKFIIFRVVMEIH